MKAATSLLTYAALYFFIFAVMFTAGCAGTERTDLNISPVPSTTDVPAKTPYEPDEEEISQQPETIYGVAPVDWVNSELSREYFPRLVKAYKSMITEPDNERYVREEYPFQLFAAEPFEGGALLFAGYTIDQDYPDLYYMEGGELICQAVESEYFSLNYTVFKDHTISYGLTLADEVDFKQSVKTVGTFANGAADEYTSHDKGDYFKGYILIAEGQTWLTSIEFFDSEGRFVTDEKSYQIGWNQDCYHWKGKQTEVWNVQRYTPMNDITTYKYSLNRLMFRYGEAENEATEMHVFADNGAGIHYVWRSHNNLVNECGAKTSEKIDIMNLPPDAQIYWADIERDDGTDEGVADLLVKGDLQAPDKPGAYCLIVKADGYIHTLFVVVEK